MDGSGGGGSDKHSGQNRVCRSQPHPDKVAKFTEETSGVGGLTCKYEAMFSAEVSSCSVAEQRVRTHARVQQRKRWPEVARVAALLLLLLLHRLLLLLTVSARQQHTRRCPVGILIPLHQNPVYLPDNLICRTQSPVQMGYNGFILGRNSCPTFERERERAMRREGLRMTQFYKYNGGQVMSDCKRRCCV